jgi:molybdenum cofactor cytidylyltransferase
VPALKLDSSIAGLILAAGESSRMGRDKALLPYGDRTFLETIVATLRQAGVLRIAVVLGHHAEEIRRAVDLGDAGIVINPDYRLGQTSSLQAGLRSLDIPAVEAILLCLVDHPAVSADSVQVMIQTFRESGAPVIVPSFEKRRGHPVLMSRCLFQELLALDSSRGANTVIHRYDQAARTVEVPDGGILIDIDDPEAYSRLA